MLYIRQTYSNNVRVLVSCILVCNVKYIIFITTGSQRDAITLFAIYTNT